MTDRPKVRDLEFDYPDCPYCGKSTDHDGNGFVCYQCKVSWDDGGRRGRWDEPGPGCPSTIEWFNRPDLEAKYENIRHVRERCILVLDHYDKHQGEDEWTRWDDEDPRVVISSLEPDEEARLLVRHGYNKLTLVGMKTSVLAWIGEKV